MKYRLEREDNLFRIIALIDIGLDVKAGDKGGLIEKEQNLSQEGNAWVYGDARVYGNARVSRAKHATKVINLILSKHSVTIDGKYMTIGCQSHKLTHWLENYKSIGKDNGYSQKQVAEYGAALEFINKTYFQSEVADA